MLRRMPALAAVVALCAAQLAAAGEVKPAPEKAELRVAVLNLATNAPAAEAAPGVTALLSSKLSETPGVKVISEADIATALGIERQKQVLGAQCTDGSCMAELSGALGTRFVVAGRLDRFGPTYVLTATLFDSLKAVSVAKPRADAQAEEALPAATEQVASELLAALGVSTSAESPQQRAGRFNLGLKLGNQFITSLLALNPGADLELGWGFDPEWLAFLQIGFNLVRTQDAELHRLTVVPSVLGVRKLYRLDKSFQPYWGLGLGLQLSIGQYGFFRDTDSFPTVIGMIGFQYLFTQRFGLLVEGSTNVAQAVLGLRHARGLGNGLNFDLSAGPIYRF